MGSSAAADVSPLSSRLPYSRHTCARRASPCACTGSGCCGRPCPAGGGRRGCVTFSSSSSSSRPPPPERPTRCPLMSSGPSGDPSSFVGVRPRSGYHSRWRPQQPAQHSPSVPPRLTAAGGGNVRGDSPRPGRVPPPSSLDRADLKRISLRSRAFLK